MGWPEEQTLDSSMPYIESAYRGRVKMLQAIGLIGTPDVPDAPPPGTETRPMTPALFDALFSGKAP